MACGSGEDGLEQKLYFCILGHIFKDIYSIVEPCSFVINQGS